jgi:hypothetical protein
MEKVLQMIHKVENLEDFIKICAADYKLDHDAAREILRLITEIKEIGVK